MGKRSKKSAATVTPTTTVQQANDPRPSKKGILGEDEEWILVNYWDSSKQHTEMLPKEEETLKPYVFNYNNCFVSAVFVRDWQPYEGVIKLDKITRVQRRTWINILMY